MREQSKPCSQNRYDFLDLHLHGYCFDCLARFWLYSAFLRYRCRLFFIWPLDLMINQWVPSKFSSNKNNSYISKIFLSCLEFILRYNTVVCRFLGKLIWLLMQILIPSLQWLSSTRLHPCTWNQHISSMTYWRKSGYFRPNPVNFIHSLVHWPGGPDPGILLRQGVEHRAFVVIGDLLKT